MFWNNGVVTRKTAQKWSQNTTQQNNDYDYHIRIEFEILPLVVV